MTTVYIVDDKGKVREQLMGEQTADGVLAKLKALRGPVRSLLPSLVFEVAFEGINASPRHKSGVAVRFPRILRWREDKPPTEADRLDALKALAQ